MIGEAEGGRSMRLLDASPKAQPSQGLGELVECPRDW